MGKLVQCKQQTHKQHVTLRRLLKRFLDWIELESIMPFVSIKHFDIRNSYTLLVHVSVRAGLWPTRSETMKTGFLATRLMNIVLIHEGFFFFFF